MRKKGLLCHFQGIHSVSYDPKSLFPTTMLLVPFVGDQLVVPTNLARVLRPPVVGGSDGCRRLRSQGTRMPSPSARSLKAHAQVKLFKTHGLH